MQEWRKTEQNGAYTCCEQGFLLVNAGLLACRKDRSPIGPVHANSSLLCSPADRTESDKLSKQIVLTMPPEGTESDRRVCCMDYQPNVKTSSASQ